MRDVLILGIETSCDETSVAIVKNGKTILSNIISSQVDLHKEYGGVVPEIASRRHLELIIPVLNNAVEHAGIGMKDINAVAVTYGPGLVGALLVGLSSAKAVAFAIDRPLIGVNHIEGHISANFIENDIDFPNICLIVSGGHSHIVYVENYDSYKILGRTRDDAAGEVFDKVARVLGMGYPGGPLIDKVAVYGDCLAVKFPRVYFKDSLDFSFSGLKTAVLNYVNRLNNKDEGYIVEDIAASFQKAVVDVLVTNTMKAAIENNIKTVCLAGGVASNGCLRKYMDESAKENGLNIIYPKPVFCTDNAVMIAVRAYHDYINDKFSDFDLNAIPGLKLGSK